MADEGAPRKWLAWNFGPTLPFGERRRLKVVKAGGRQPPGGAQPPTLPGPFSWCSPEILKALKKHLFKNNFGNEEDE